MKTHKLMTLLSLFILSFVFVQAQEMSADPVITLERTPCFGSCPVYSVSIFEDGTVVYNGDRFVEITGEQTAEIDPDTVVLMLDAIEDAGYFDWDAAYDTQTISDLPTITTSVTHEEQTHRIVHYVGDSSAPLTLPYIEQWIDVMANTAIWTGVQPEILNIATQSLTVISLERSACYGFCPVYKLALFEDGTGVFMGMANVETIGVQTFEVDPSFVTNIIQQAEIFGYFDWLDSYENHLRTDQATVIMMVHGEDQYKRIVRYEGDPNAPVGLIWLEGSIVQILPLEFIGS